MARILVVEEGGQLFAELEEVLGHAGHTVERAQVVKKLRDCPADETFDLVVADTPMPDWCEPRFLRELRRRCPNVRLVALTGGHGLSSVGYLPAAARFGAVCILRKPFSREELLEAVERALSPRTTEEPAESCTSR